MLGAFAFPVAVFVTSTHAPETAEPLFVTLTGMLTVDELGTGFWYIESVTGTVSGAFGYDAGITVVVTGAEYVMPLLPFERVAENVKEIGGIGTFVSGR